MKINVNFNKKLMPFLAALFCCAMIAAFFHYHLVFNYDMSKCPVCSFLNAVGLLNALLISLPFYVYINIYRMIEKRFFYLDCLSGDSFLRGPPAFL